MKNRPNLLSNSKKQKTKHVQLNPTKTISTSGYISRVSANCKTLTKKSYSERAITMLKIIRNVRENDSKEQNAVYIIKSVTQKYPGALYLLMLFPLLQVDWYLILMKNLCSLLHNMTNSVFFILTSESWGRRPKWGFQLLLPRLDIG